MPEFASSATSRLVGLPALMTAAMHGQDLTAIGQKLQLHADNGNPSAMMDLAVLLQLILQRDTALALQAEALAMSRLYHYIPSQTTSDLRLLAIVAPGDLMTNTPLEFVAEGVGFQLDLLYVDTDSDVIGQLPDHDIAIIAISELDRNQRILRLLKESEGKWIDQPLNLPSRIERLRRDAVPDLLQNCSGVHTPRTIAAGRRELSILVDDNAISSLLPDSEWPLLVRPIDSHAGQGLSRVDDPQQLGEYLQDQNSDQFFVTQFVDYRSSHDDQFRKYRVMMIDGQPHLAHMGIDQHWMVHYDSAGMKESATKRQEEAAVMQTFASGFARKHADAFQQIHQRVGLEYFGIDCGETHDGQLLIFEVCASLAIHAMDSIELFPYKQPQMASIFTAFKNMLERRKASLLADRPEEARDVPAELEATAS